MDLSKKNCFSTEEAINYIPSTERKEIRYEHVKRLSPSSGSLSSSMLPILSWKLKIIA